MHLGQDDAPHSAVTTVHALKEFRNAFRRRFETEQLPVGVQTPQPAPSILDYQSGQTSQNRTPATYEWSRQETMIALRARRAAFDIATQILCPYIPAAKIADAFVVDRSCLDQEASDHAPIHSKDSHDTLLAAVPPRSIWMIDVLKAEQARFAAERQAARRSEAGFQRQLCVTIVLFLVVLAFTVAGWLLRQLLLMV